DVSNTDADGAMNVSHRVVADHLRATSFLIADGVLPSNEGRGYVLRRIMRRAMRHLHQLGCEEPVMYRLVPSLVAEMGGHYPELGRAQPLITETLKLEETRFKETLGRGLRLLNEEIEGKEPGGVLDGATAFKLYDTYGFPLDLTQDFMRGYGWGVDTDAFDSAMAAQKAAARKAWSGSGDSATEAIWLDLGDRLGSTEFLGYTSQNTEGKVTALVVDGAEVDSVASGTVSVITNQTPFYAESGGQQGDTGSLTWDGGSADVTDTFKTPAGMFVHRADITEGTLTTETSLRMDIDHDRRRRLRANHSATHLLHEALRHVLGDHVAQKGSLVAPDRLRFDFSHARAVSALELAQVQAIVNERIRMNSDVSTRIMTPDAAIELGALALFGEKYGDEVRVVQMGGAGEVAGRGAWSVELCGGTHVSRTGDISLLKIVSESAVAGGVRRIEAVTEAGALNWLDGRDAILMQAAELLKVAPEQLGERVARLIEDNRKAERDITALRRKLAAGGGGSGDGPAVVNGINFVGRLLEDTPARELKSMADEIKMSLTNGVICLVATDGGKASIVVAVTADLADQQNAVDLVKAGSAALGGGGGGGRPDMAQAGGPNADAAAAAIEAVSAALG
ncbi:MAG TPA: alanine--tRNA ligase, partial [Alphaproteobacteria bacterium]|nr:alanine--tRNA ligase [Alphaproteobacteria bacterium]